MSLRLQLAIGLMVPRHNRPEACKLVIQLLMVATALVANQEISVLTGDFALALAMAICIEEPAQIKPGVQMYAFQTV